MSGSEAKKAARASFEAVYEKIRNELVDHLAKNGMPTEAVEWYRSVRPPRSSQNILQQSPRRISITMSRAENSIVECPSSIPSKSSRDAN